MKKTVLITYFLLLFVFVIIVLLTQTRISATVDENRWIEAGKAITKTGFTDQYDELCHPILFMVSQACIRHWFTDGSHEFDLRFARISVLPWHILCLTVLFFWARRVHGYYGGLLATALLVFSPTYLAHATLVTTDALVAAAILFTAAAFTRLLTSMSLANSLYLTLSLAFGLLSKFSYLLIPLVLLFFTLIYPGSVRVRFRRLLFVWVIPIVFSIVIVNLAYGFKGTGQHLQQGSWTSDSFDSLASGWTGKIPMPLPERYLKGMDIHLKFSHEWKAFMRGQVSMNGFAGYDAFAFLVKTTVPALILILISLFSMFYKRRPTTDETVVFGLALIWLLYFSFIHRVDCGVRYVLPVYPLLFFLAGRVTCLRSGKIFSGLRLSIGLLAWHSLASINSYPFFISFFNTASGGSSKGFLLLSDSNICWAHDLKELQSYQRTHAVDEYIFGLESRVPLLDPYIQYRPITHREKFFPSSGTFAIWVVSLQQFIHPDPNAFLWLRLTSPNAILGNSSYVYHVQVPPGEELQYMRKAYRKSKTEGFAFPWAEKHLDENDGLMFFPLLSIPATHNGLRFDLDANDAPPTHLLSVSPFESAIGMQVSILESDGRIIPGKVKSELWKDKMMFEWDEEVKASRIIVYPIKSSVPIEEICLVYDLKSDPDL